MKEDEDTQFMDNIVRKFNNEPELKILSSEKQILNPSKDFHKKTNFNQKHYSVAPDSNIFIKTAVPLGEDEQNLQ